jgi:hypothetical protein
MFVVIVMIMVVIAVIMITVMVAFALVFAMPFAGAHIMAMNPFVMMFRPMAGYPHPQVSIVPIRWTIVIRPITYLDRDSDGVGRWPNKHANRQESRYKNRKFPFHSVINHSVLNHSQEAISSRCWPGLPGFCPLPLSALSVSAFPQNPSTSQHP